MTPQHSQPRQPSRPDSSSHVQEWLWVRWGDSSGYERFDALDEADFAYRFPRRSCVLGFVEFGFLVPPDFVGFNYVSCFWGDAQAHPLRQLNASEQRLITNLVGSL